MMRGDGDVVSGWKNKLQSAIANVTPAGVLAEQHRKNGRTRLCTEGQRLRGRMCDGAIGSGKRDN